MWATAAILGIIWTICISVQNIGFWPGPIQYAATATVVILWFNFCYYMEFERSK